MFPSKHAEQLVDVALNRAALVACQHVTRDVRADQEYTRARAELLEYIAELEQYRECN